MRFGSSRRLRSGGMYFAPRYGEPRRGRHSRSRREFDILDLLPRRRRGGRYFAPRRRLPAVPKPALLVMGLLLVAIVALSWPSGGNSKKTIATGALAAATGSPDAQRIVIDGADTSSASSSTLPPDVVVAVTAPDAVTSAPTTNLDQPPAGLVPLGKFTVFCYALKGTTASGLPVSNDVVAVDSRVVPLGTRIWIEGVGWRTALDRGSAIVGKDLDVWNASVDWCLHFGKRYVSVWREP